MNMVRETLAAVIFLFATGLRLHADMVRPGGFTPLNIVSYSPGREEVAAKDSVEYFQRTGNDIVLYSLTLHPQGRPAMDTVDRAVASYRKFAALLKGTGVRPGILLQAILGHWALGLPRDARFVDYMGNERAPSPTQRDGDKTLVPLAPYPLYILSSDGEGFCPPCVRRAVRIGFAPSGPSALFLEV